MILQTGVNEDVLLPQQDINIHARIQNFSQGVPRFRRTFFFFFFFFFMGGGGRLEGGSHRILQRGERGGSYQYFMRAIIGPPVKRHFTVI